MKQDTSLIARNWRCGPSSWVKHGRMTIKRSELFQMSLDWNAILNATVGQTKHVCSPPRSRAEQRRTTYAVSNEQSNLPHVRDTSCRPMRTCDVHSTTIVCHHRSYAVHTNICKHCHRSFSTDVGFTVATQFSLFVVPHPLFSKNMGERESYSTYISVSGLM
jgi:hypothetical protein